MAHIGSYKQADRDLHVLSERRQSADNEALGRRDLYVTQVAWLTQQSTATSFNNTVTFTISFALHFEAMHSYMRL